MFRCWPFTAEKRFNDKNDPYGGGRQDQRRRLFAAIIAQDLTTVARLVAVGADEHYRDGNRTALHLACETGCLPIVRHLVQYGKRAHLTAQDGMGYTCLHCAQSHVTLWLIENNSRVEVNAVDQNGDTALHVATRMGNLAKVKVLVESGKAHLLCANTKCQSTLLHIAASKGHPEIFAYLLKQKGAPLLLVRDQDGNTPLHVACRDSKRTLVNHILQYWRTWVGSLSVASALAAGGLTESPLVCTNHNGDTCLHLLVQSRNTALVEFWIKETCHSKENVNAKLLTAQNKEGDTALHIACRLGDQDIIKALLIQRSKGASSGDEPFLCRNTHGETPLYLAADWGADNDKPLTALLQSMCHLSDTVVAPCGPTNKDTLLHVLCAKGWLSMFRLIMGRLQEEGTKDRLLRVTNDRGETLLHTCVTQNHLGLVRYLLDQTGGRDLIAAESQTGKTPLHLACQVPLPLVDQAIVAHLVARATPVQMNRAENAACGHSPLHAAAASGRWDAVLCLVERQTTLGNNSLWAKCQGPEHASGCNAFHLACQYGHLQIAQWLHETAATSPSQKHELLVSTDDRGRTALHAAARRKREGVFVWLCRLNTSAAAVGCGDTVDTKGDTVLHTLCETGQHKLLQVLAACHKRGFGANRWLARWNRWLVLANGQGHTPLDLACLHGHHLVVEWLLETFQDTLWEESFCRNGGATPLHLACSRGHLKTVEVLLGHPAASKYLKQANDEDDGNTPLHCAAQCDDNGLPVVQRLVNSGAEVDVPNKRGETPLLLAKGLDTVFWLLTEGGALSQLTEAG